MVKKELKDKINQLIFWSGLFCLMYLIVGYLIQSNCMQFFLESKAIYELLRDALTLTAYFLAPAAALVLFSDWRIQHNKDVKNKFALDVINQFGKFEEELLKARYICIELEQIVHSEGWRGKKKINDPILNKHRELIFSFNAQVNIILDEINVFIDKLRNLSIVNNTEIQVAQITLQITNNYLEPKEDHENYEYKYFEELLQFNSNQVDHYLSLRDFIFDKIIYDNLHGLRAD